MMAVVLGRQLHTVGRRRTMLITSVIAVELSLTILRLMMRVKKVTAKNPFAISKVSAYVFVSGWRRKCSLKREQPKNLHFGSRFN